ncbi:hypothetical protein [Pseudoduganella aquatica]|uniref:hypothetical protein n=1 Tax=Pseudoduganella aquatica TaxID=2660641 RepID=UPI001E4A0E8C|nr:hypothetical protein [Pseudoduganella aquatica]
MATEQDLQALSPSDRERLERLAALGGRTPLDMLYYVQRDGFEECEECVQASLLAEQEFADGCTIPHKEVMDEARLRVELYAKQPSNAK